MKKVAWIFVFLIVLIAGDRLLGWYLEKQVTNSQFRYSRLYRGNASADIMIIGNSRGLNVYIPSIEELTSKKAFSLSYNGMPSDLAAVLTKDYIDRYPTVKKVIVELCMAEMPDDQLTPGFSSYMQFSTRIDSLIKSKSYNTWYTSKLSHIFQFNNEVFQRALFYKNKSDDDWTSDRKISSKLINEVGNYGMTFLGDDKQLQQVKLITDYCRLHKIEVTLLIAPFFPGFVVKDIDRLKDKAEKITGFKVHDYSTALQNSSSFSDYLHMNVIGCKEFAALLLKDGHLSTEASLQPTVKL